MQNIISVKSLNKSYKTGKVVAKVLRDVSFSVKAGEFLAIVGPSGSGKSTLIRAIGGLNIPDSGSVELLDKNLYKLSDRALSAYRNQTIGFVFQDHRLIPYYNALENVVVPLKIAGHKSADQELKAQKVLAAMGLSQHLNTKAANLSGGQQQRVGIARALIANPRLIIADEPTGNLDSLNSAEIIRLLKMAQKNLQTTIIIVTHDENLAKQANRVIRLLDGRIIENYEN